MDKLFHKAEFNEKARFGLLRNNVMRVAELSMFSIYHSPSTYEGLKKVIRDFENETRVYRSARAFPGEVSSSYGTEKAQKTVINRGE